jgi:crotonobetainyl-CoA:carnitine CoA-transferase CaiB-like acyl-CoA transferase
MQFDGAGLEIHRRAPEVGEHTDEVFGEIGVDPAEIARLRELGALV